MQTLEVWMNEIHDKLTNDFIQQFCQTHSKIHENRKWVIRKNISVISTKEFVIRFLNNLF